MGRVIWKGKPERCGFWFLYLAGALVVACSATLVASAPGIPSLVLFSFSIPALLICTDLAELERVTVYVLTGKEVEVRKSPRLGGIKKVALKEVGEVKLRTSLFERMKGLGTVEVVTPSRVLVFRGVRDPEKVRGMIAEAVERAKKRVGT